MISWGSTNISFIQVVTAFVCVELWSSGVVDRRVNTWSYALETAQFREMVTMVEIWKCLQCWPVLESENLSGRVEIVPRMCRLEGASSSMLEVEGWEGVGKQALLGRLSLWALQGLWRPELTISAYLQADQMETFVFQDGDWHHRLAWLGPRTMEVEVILGKF